MRFEKRTKITRIIDLDFITEVGERIRPAAAKFRGNSQHAEMAHTRAFSLLVAGAFNKQQGENV